jgi:hypothetical protein
MESAGVCSDETSSNQEDEGSSSLPARNPTMSHLFGDISSRSETNSSTTRSPRGSYSAGRDLLTAEMEDPSTVTNQTKSAMADMADFLRKEREKTTSFRGNLLSDSKVGINGEAEKTVIDGMVVEENTK